jgi:FKBP-type peptidyl-prolyl cis-trans isomerase FklB
MFGIKGWQKAPWAGVIAGILLLSGLAGCGGDTEKPKLETLEERVAYGIGLRIGQDFRAREFPVDAEVVVRGLRDGLAAKPPLLSDQEIQEALTALQKELNERQQQNRQSLAEKNLIESRNFLSRKAKEIGVQTLPSGLLYQVLRPGKGNIPGPSDQVTVHYRGRLVDGTEFDNSYARNRPATFPVAGVIPGWREALQKMRPGGKWRIYLSPELAYGEQGAGTAIGPNVVLIYEIELLEIVRSEAKEIGTWNGR